MRCDAPAHEAGRHELHAERDVPPGKVVVVAHGHAEAVPGGRRARWRLFGLYAHRLGVLPASMHPVVLILTGGSNLQCTRPTTTADPLTMEVL